MSVLVALGVSCPSTLAFEGYLWPCVTPSPRHEFHVADLPIGFVERGLALVHWGTSQQAPDHDPSPRWAGPIYTTERTN